MTSLQIVWRFMLAGLVGSVFTGVVLPPAAWGIGLIREGAQLHVANTGSTYFFLAIIFLWYAVPISFFVSAIGAVIGRRWCGALLGVAGTVVFAFCLGTLSVSSLGVMANGVVAAVFICCGIGASAFHHRWFNK